MGNESPKLMDRKNKQPKVLESRKLFGVDNELIIEHGGQQYRLRITSLGKLILTK